MCMSYFSLSSTFNRFLWVVLQIEAICADCNSDEEIEEVLRSLPATLAETYSRCLLRIPKRRPGDLRLAPKILRWVIFANRSLHEDELKEAIAFGSADTAWNSGKVPKTITNCGNLLVFDEAGTVRLAHSTVRQYLLSEKQPDSKVVGLTSEEQTEVLKNFDFKQEQAELEIGEDCVTYLSFSDFNTRSVRTAETGDFTVPNIPPPLTALSALTSPFVNRFMKRPFSRSGQLKNTIVVPRTKTVRTEPLKYKLLEYAKTHWAIHTTHMSNRSPVWENFKRLALTQNRSWKLQPWIKDDFPDAAQYKSLFQWAIDHEHIPLLNLVDSLPPGSKLLDLGKQLWNGDPPLSYAADNNRAHAVAFLLDHCKVNGKNRDGETALHCAARQGHSAVVGVLLTAGKININARSKKKSTPLLLAAYGGHMEVAQLLLGKGADSAVKDVAGKGVWYATALSGNWEFLKLLLDNNAPFEHNFRPQNTSLVVEASKGNWEAVVQLLLEKELDVNAQDGSCAEALYKASRGGHEMIVRLLLERGVDIDAQDGMKGTPLQAASSQGHEMVVRLLLERGADVNAQDGMEENPWQAASSQLLFESRVDVNIRSGYYGNALNAASCNGYEKVVQLLLENGADVNIQIGHYGNALNAASCYGYEKVVRLLLESGADVNIQSGHYGNALNTASYCGHEKVVQLLLENGADVNIQSGYYGNALNAATFRGHTSVARLLSESMKTGVSL